jgi:hypothetical protein
MSAVQARRAHNMNCSDLHTTRLSPREFSPPDL